MAALAALLLAAAPGAAQQAPSAPAPAVKSVVRADPRSGRLVRSVVAPRAPRTAQPAPRLNELIEQTAARHEVDPHLVRSVIAVESNFNQYAVSPKGAQGLMQLIPATARRFGVANPFDPASNLEAGVKYLKYLKNLFQDERLALAAYNAGEGAVQRYKGVPPYAETRDYVEKVRRLYGTALQNAPAPDETAPAVPLLRSLESVLGSDGRIYLRTRE
ncbi:MAG: lytic transglycosylase domain-containing protein [Bryobacteraceae bacterium]|nr:lytic transglycosylase domain-containing protein [Bryobacteraceae bacterium]